MSTENNRVTSRTFCPDSMRPKARCTYFTMPWPPFYACTALQCGGHHDMVVVRGRVPVDQSADARHDHGRSRPMRSLPRSSPAIISFPIPPFSPPAMFSRLPQKLPFNLLGDEAKLAFRSQPGGIAKLATTRVSAEAHCGENSPESPVDRIYQTQTTIGIKSVHTLA